MIKPLISVYMPTKNRCELAKRAIESVMSQQYSNFEMVVVDDGSTDDTPAMLAQYAKNHRNFRFIRNEKSQGAAAARNTAVENSRGELVTGIDDDDWFLPERLRIMQRAYHDHYAFICTGVIWDFGLVDNKRKRKKADYRAKVFGLAEQLSYNHATTQVLVSKERLLSIGGFDTNLVARIDYDGWTRLIEHFGPAKRIADTSYVLSRDEGLERITNSARNIEGNEQFFAKHQHLMNRANRLNQQFWDLYARNGKLSIWRLFEQLTAGLCWFKVKYYLRVNFFTV